jgi:hypothetical protein
MLPQVMATPFGGILYIPSNSFPGTINNNLSVQTSLRSQQDTSFYLYLISLVENETPHMKSMSPVFTRC